MFFEIQFIIYFLTNKISNPVKRCREYAAKD